MRKTLFRQLLIYLLLFGIVLSLASYLVIEFFFDDYYYSQQEKVLTSKAEALVSAYNESGIDGLQPLIDEYSVDFNMSVHFLDTSTGKFYGTTMQGTGKQGLVYLLNSSEKEKAFISTTGQQNNSPKNWLSYMLETNDGNLLLARISYTGMDSVVGLVQQFFLFFGLAMAFAFAIFAYFFSKSMSTPLKKLNEIAEKMGHLDFSLKYHGIRVDEIGQLGKTLNHIASNLENTISQLQGELSKERTLEKMRTQFTAQVSHELQTPLSVIKGYSEALSDRLYSDAEAPEIYNILLTEAGKISNMVDDLLNLSQMESGAYVIRKSEFSIADLMEKIFNRYKNLPYDKKFEMFMTKEPHNNYIYSGDAVRLEQAIRNVLTNAIKHVSENGIISLYIGKDSGACLLKIFNSGTSIPEDELNLIFNSYYQGKNSRDGKGLGLAITRHIIELHNGTITAENVSDGVLFTITLP